MPSLSKAKNPNSLRLLLNVVDALVELRDAWEAMSPSKADAQDSVASCLLPLASLHLPDSARMQKAASAGLAESGRDAIDDGPALSELAYLICKGYGLWPASREAARLAQNPAAVSDKHIAARLRVKFSKEKEHHLVMAQVLLNLERKYGIERLPGSSVLSYIKVILDAERKHGIEHSPAFSALSDFLAQLDDFPPGKRNPP
jgi:hypothetical protein